MAVRSGARLILACSALLSIAPVLPAQVKVAVINLQRAVLDSAEIKKASAAMEARYKPRQAEAQQIEQKLGAIQQNLQANAGKLTPQAEADMQAQGQRLQKQLTRIQEDLQGDVERDRNEILGKASQKMGDIVKKIAEEKGLDMVVDISNTIYFKPALEITSDAIAAYDKAYPAK
jgi:outer membrane protein